MAELAILQKSALQRLRSSRLARNSAWMMAGQGASLVLQTASLFVLARLLGSREYGVYVGAVAFCSMLGQYAANGAGTLYLRYVSADASQHRLYLGNIFLSLIGLGTLVVIGLRVAAPYLLSAQSASLIVVVAIAECLCRQGTEALTRIFQTHEQMKATALLSLLVNALRCAVAVAMLILLHHASARQWALGSAAVSVVGLVAVALLAGARFGAPLFDMGLLRRRFSEGIGFSFAGSTFSVYNDIDKTMLSHYGMNAANGLYSIAYRVIDTATMPSWSIYAASLPSMFRKGAQDVRLVRPLARKLLLASLFTSVPAAALVFVAAPLAPMLLGPSFNEAALAIRWLAILPVLRSFQLSGGCGLTGAGCQRFRTAGQLGAAVVNFGLNLYLIPHYSWLGAAWASIVTDGLIAVSNWVLLLWVSARRTQRAPLENRRTTRITHLVAPE